jgi:FHA domain/von Willebrand factor type A domain
VTRALVIALFVLGAIGIARADDDPTHPAYRAVIDRAELEPASITGLRLRVYLSALAIGGQMLDLTDPKSIKLYVGGSEKKFPYALGTYAATGSPIDMVVLVQITSDFTDALPMIADSMDRDLLAHLSDRVKVGIATFGDAATVPKLAPAKQLRGKVSLASDGSTGDPSLSDAIDRALIVLKKTDPDARKMIVVIGDGRDSAADHDRVTRTGERAAKDGVRIHTIAYSPADLRRPLLVLGELAKRSLGTLRWPGQGRKPTIDSWTEAFTQLAGEIDKQYVLTFFAPADEELAGKKLHIVTVGRTETSSNDVKVPDLAAGAAASIAEASAGGHHILRWLAIIGGAIVGLVILLGLVGFLMSKRSAPRAPMPVARPGQPVAMPSKGPVAPGLLPNGRPIPALLITGGPRAGERMLLRHGFSIGKQPGSDLLIEDGYTSSQHAQIAMDADGNCHLYDHNSTNGTFVNNQRITAAPLAHGAMIKIGSTELRFLAQ